MKLLRTKAKIFKTLSAILWAMLLLGSAEIFAAADDENLALRYTVDLEDTRNHYLTIKVEVPVDSDTTELMMAVWTPRVQKSTRPKHSPIHQISNLPTEVLTLTAVQISWSAKNSQTKSAKAYPSVKLARKIPDRASRTCC